MKKILFLCNFIMIMFSLELISCQNLLMPSNRDVKNAEKYFAELENLLGRSSTETWGIDLYGPTMFVNPNNRMILANQQNKDSTFKKKGNVFYGFLPDEYNIANTAMSFSGELWTCVSGWEFENDMERNLLLVHESFHRVQNAIGIQSVMSNNTHLDDEVDASILLKLELLALSKTFHSAKIDYNDENLVNALTIRNIRQNLYPDNNENEYECHEGLAEYAAYKIVFNDVGNDIIMKALLLNKVENALTSDNYANSFAYVTGPVYAFILDELSSGWRDEVMKGSTMADIFLKNIIVSCDDYENVVKDIVKHYDAERFINEEYNRLTSLKLEDAVYVNRFNESDLLYIKNDNVRFAYNPNERLISYNDIGTIYKTMRLSGDFGVLELNDGVLVTYDWKYFIMPYNVEDKDSCDLNFNEDYSIKKVADKRYELYKL